MEKHWPEPWFVAVRGEDTVEILDAHGRQIMELSSPDGLEHILIHAGRIIACVNLWTGTPTEELDYILRVRERFRKHNRPA